MVYNSAWELTFSCFCVEEREEMYVQPWLLGAALAIISVSVKCCFLETFSLPLGEWRGLGTARWRESGVHATAGLGGHPLEEAVGAFVTSVHTA